MTGCPCCGARVGEPFLVRRGVPVHQNMILESRALARAIARGDLEMCACPSCGFVFNRAFDPSLLRYGARYDNDQSFSETFRAYLDGLERRIVDERGVKDRTIVEVGCGNGSFLRRLVEDPARGNTGWGFDPAYRGPEADANGRLRFRRAPYGPDCVVAGADVVVCRHLIEHVPDPSDLLAALRTALGGAVAPILFFETPCVDWILRHRVVWDFFYEHCSLFSSRSLASAFERAGFGVETVGHVFGGQYLWLEAGTASAPAVPRGPGETLDLAAEFAGHELAEIDALRRVVERERAAGSVALWGAGAKGVTLANLIDPDGELVDCVVDVNPRKQGNYLPGTGHPIVAPDALRARNVVAAIPMNPNYRAENEAIIERAGISVRLVEPV